MEELKTNLGKKMITSFGLTPSPSKHKQLITSDITLPIYEVSSRFCSRLNSTLQLRCAGQYSSRVRSKLLLSSVY